jgi:hypothetical protein
VHTPQISDSHDDFGRAPPGGAFHCLLNSRFFRVQDTCGPLLIRVSQPLYLTLSFGEIPWFDDHGEIRRCDWWLQSLHSLEVKLSNKKRKKRIFRPITALDFPPIIKPRNFANKRQCTLHWLTPSTLQATLEVLCGEQTTLQVQGAL